MEEALELLQSKDTKERMSGVDRLQALLEQSKKSLSSSEVGSLVDACLVLLKDNNFRVSQGALQALASASVLSGEQLKLHFNVLLPAIVERLGDSKQPVRDAARRLLLALMEISSPTIIVERAGSHAWTHKNWRVREEFARTAASAINLFASTELPFQRVLLPSILQLLEDPNSNAREAAMGCLEEMYRQGGTQVQDELQKHSVRPSQLKDILGRFEKIVPKISAIDIKHNQFSTAEVKVQSSPSSGVNPRKSPKTKTQSSDISSAGDEEKPAEPIRVHSDKELTKEVEKVTAMLAPEQEWSVRMGAMQRMEGLVVGGATEYACFPSLLKQLVSPLSIQLADRRSTIVKQACQLINLLSKELLADFEHCGESFIPVLLKIVVITVLVIAESADTCIKTMLRNCRVARALPRIMETAKNHRNPVLRARCCEYALLSLEQWSESPEIQKLVDMYEDFIKCCVGDAMSEVRATARNCYRVFARCWPDRARKLFACFDPVMQRLINEEDGGLHKRYTSPSMRDKSSNQARTVTSSSQSASASAGSQILSFGASPIVAMDKGLASKKEPSERSLESMLQASKQQVNAIETMLKGIDISEKSEISSARPSNGKEHAVAGSYRKLHNSGFPSKGGYDVPSTHDPHAMQQSATKNSVAGVAAYIKGSQTGNSMPGSFSNGQGFSAYSASVSQDMPSSVLPMYAVKRVPINSDRSSQGSSNDEGIDTKPVRRMLKSELAEKQVLEHSSHNSQKGNSCNSVPGFQRPLMRHAASTRSSISSRGSMDETPAPFDNYMDGLVSLNEALSEGLSANADWAARVAAFNYVKKLLQQGPRGFQDIMQSFEKIIKLFCQHLDDPHHKVAQAALSTLAEIVPVCRKPFESYLERILPHVFSRLVDPKEFIRRLGSGVLETVGNLYTIDSLLPALLRSLDEQRSPKSKMAVIEFANAAFAKLAMNGEAPTGNNLLRMWLAKLAPIANEKNAKLKEAAVNGIISVYSHFDSSAVLNYILGLTIEEQSSLRRSLKQYTPRIEVELMNYLQNRSQRLKSRSTHDQIDVTLSSDDGFGIPFAKTSPVLKNQLAGNFLSNDTNRKWSGVGSLEPAQTGARLLQSASENIVMEGSQTYENPTLYESAMTSRSRNIRDGSTNQTPLPVRPNLVARQEIENAVLPVLDVARQLSSESVMPLAEGRNFSIREHENEQNLQKFTPPKPIKKLTPQEVAACIPAWLNELSSGNDEKALEKKCSALHEILRLSKANHVPTWSQFINQILTGVLEVFDDPDPSVREVAIATVLEMIANQKDMLEDSVEVMVEKLLHSTRDLVAKVSIAADRCLSVILSQYDPYRCLSVVVPLLNSEDEKTLVTCIGSLTKLVGRIPSEDLMTQLPSFLPALFDAFSNQSADVRKTVVFCLVDIYIVLGKAFLPYLGSLSSTQLRLVTIYANRISQARTGASVDSSMT